MARQKKNRFVMFINSLQKAVRLARKQERAERLVPQRQKQQAKAERRKAARRSRKANRQVRREESRAQKVSQALEKKSPVIFDREQKSAATFFGHAPNARELNTWRGLVNSGAIDRIKELTYINYEPEAVKDAAADLLKTDMSSDEIVSALEGYIKEYAAKEQSLYDYVESKYGAFIPR